MNPLPFLYRLFLNNRALPIQRLPLPERRQRSCPKFFFGLNKPLIFKKNRARNHQSRSKKFALLLLLASRLPINSQIMKVLIIEQEKTLQQSLSYYLEHHKNFEVLLAHSKKEGISLLETSPCDMVLCGDRLPDANGLDTLKELVQKNPQIISVLMTVQGDESLREEALKAGIRGYLEKPFDLKQLEEVMDANRSQ